MTNSKNQNKKHNNRSGKKYESTINTLMIRARNPIVTRQFVLSVQGYLGSTAGGVMAGALLMDPSGASEWASLALLYDQFRVLGGQLKICSMIPNTAVGGGLVRFAFDNDSTTTPASYADVMQYSEVTDVPALFTNGVKTVNFRRPVLRGVPQQGSIWYNETSPASSPGALKYYSQGLTGTTTYWSYVLDYLVEFQMRS